MKTCIIHIPTNLFLSYCYWPKEEEIHIVLTEKITPERNNQTIIEYLYEIISNDNFYIHFEDEIYTGSADEFILVKYD